VGGGDIVDLSNTISSQIKSDVKFVPVPHSKIGLGNAEDSQASYWK
jgi:hypothetical protein